MGKSKKSSSVQTVSPPDYYKDDIVFALDEAKRLYNEGAPDYYGGQMSANLDPLQMEAINRTVDMARTGSPLVDQAQNVVSDMMTRQAGQNPYLDQMLAKYGADANAAVMANFNKSGRMGSGANAATAATAYADATLPHLFNQYNTDMSNRLNAASMAPTLAEQDYLDAGRIGTAGDILRGQSQQQLDEALQKWQYETNAPYTLLDAYTNTVYGSPAADYTTTTSVQKQSGGGLGSALGTIASIASMFTPAGPLAGMASSAGFGVGSMLSGLGATNLGGGLMKAFGSGQQMLSGGNSIYWK